MSRIGVVATTKPQARNLIDDLGLANAVAISATPDSARGLVLDGAILDETNGPLSAEVYEAVLPAVAAGRGVAWQLRRLDHRMTFGDALDRLRAGDAVTRRGWNGAKQYLMLQKPDARSKMTLPYIYITTTQGGRVPWAPSQTDVLADDWELFAW